MDETKYIVTQKLNIKIEKNSKGYNWEVTVTNADTVDDAIHMLDEAETKIWQMYGEPLPQELPTKPMYGEARPQEVLTKS